MAFLEEKRITIWEVAMIKSGLATNVNVTTTSNGINHFPNRITKSSIGNDCYDSEQKLVYFAVEQKWRMVGPGIFR